MTIVFEVRLNGRDIRFTPKAETITIDARARAASFNSRFRPRALPADMTYSRKYILRRTGLFRLHCRPPSQLKARLNDPNPGRAARP